MGHALDYDEFGYLEVYARREGLTWNGTPVVARHSVEVGSNIHISMLRWGKAAPEVVLLHGRGQNAHTWDSVAMALGRPLAAIDRPGHGHSDWRDDHDYRSHRIADDIATVVETFDRKVTLVGMSLGGLCALRIATSRPDLVSKLMIVDITPGIRKHARNLSKEQRGEAVLMEGRTEFDSFEEMLDEASAASPDREPQSLVAGVRHNAMQRSDGTWTWRYDPLRRLASTGHEPHFEMWDDVDDVTVPFAVVRGGLSHFVSDEDVAEVQRRAPHAKVHVVEGAGHSVQSAKPVVLSELIRHLHDAQ